MSHVGEVWEYLDPDNGGTLFLVLDDSPLLPRVKLLNLETGSITWVSFTVFNPVIPERSRWKRYA